MESKKLRVALGFVTGRASFKDVANAYLLKWGLGDLFRSGEVELSLLVAYDLDYMQTKPEDFIIDDPEILEMVTSVEYLGAEYIATEVGELSDQGVLSCDEVELLFGKGYAKLRNAVLFFATRMCFDRLIFLDDDEYPLACVGGVNGVYWLGQDVIGAHLAGLEVSDITNGYHCGYVSPIPDVVFDDVLGVGDFRLFVEAVSNDIVTWKSIAGRFKAGGLSFADHNIIDSNEFIVVEEINGLKFISGGNLGLNLATSGNLSPFFNPPGARGEDTFLSSSIGACDVRKIPVYTFHDGFGSFSFLLKGVLPKCLDFVGAGLFNSDARFLSAAQGWVKYRPLLIYITDKEHFELKISQMREALVVIAPLFAEFFGDDDFLDVVGVLDYYVDRVKEDYADFVSGGEAWTRLLKHLDKVIE